MLDEEVAHPAREPRVEVGAVEQERAVDPVCGMEVDPGSTGAEAVVNGVSYYFCSTGCRDHFLGGGHRRDV